MNFMAVFGWVECVGNTWWKTYNLKVLHQMKWLPVFKSSGEKLQQCSRLSIGGTGWRTNEHTLQNSLFTHKYQIQRQMRNSLVYDSKAFDHATFSTLKKKKKTNTKNHEHSLVHQRQKQCQIYTQNNKNNNITFVCKSTILSYILQLKLYH